MTMFASDYDEYLDIAWVTGGIARLPNNRRAGRLLPARAVTLRRCVAASMNAVI